MLPLSLDLSQKVKPSYNRFSQRRHYPDILSGDPTFINVLFLFYFHKKKKTKITVIIASLPYGVLSRLDISDVTYCLMLLEQYGLFQALGS